MASSYSIRKASPAETPAALATLPKLGRSVVSDLFVAVSRAGDMLGAGALIAPAQRGGPPVWKFALAVDPAHRRAGIGRALLRTITAEARRAGASRLRTHTSLEDGPGTRFLRALGFTASKRIFHFTVDFSGFHRATRAIRDRLVARGKIPGSARLVPLGDVSAEQVVRLIDLHLAGMRARLTESSLGRGDRPWSREDSVVLLSGDAVRAALVLGWQGATPRIYRYVIDPRFRSTWVHVVMLTAAMERMLARGSHRVRFSCYEDIRDTVRIAERCGARPEKVTRSYSLNLSATRLRRAWRSVLAIRSLVAPAAVVQRFQAFARALTGREKPRQAPV